MEKYNLDNLINPDIKTQVERFVINKLKYIDGLIGKINYNGSEEGGFTLPYNRQLRFGYNNGYISYLKSKDGAKFTNNEINQIKNNINEALLYLNNSNKLLPIPTELLNIKFNKSFNVINKKKILEYVLKNCKLKDLREDFSYEGGINLPLTKEWSLIDLKNKRLLKYHNCRQLRFVYSDINTISGLMLKDGINYMTDHELTTIKECFDNYIMNL